MKSDAKRGLRHLPIQDRFLLKVTMIPEAGCWIWMAAENATGYGRFGINGSVEFAHRASWMLFRGPIPSGIYVCHHCDVPLCVNPHHLFLGTAKDNMRDASRKGRVKMPTANHASSELHQVAKLTDAQVREIRSSRDRQAALARRFGVCPNAIWRAKTGRTFKDVK